MKSFSSKLAAGSCFLAIALPAAADQVILDDLIVDGSICVGQDCVNGESFGFDTLRLKENNLRIKAQDTSNSASFPTQDWQLTFNDSSNGGANKFALECVSPGSSTPFTVEGCAPSNSLYVDDGGRVGLGTASPVVELHVKDGDTPTLRLEQDGSSGFTPQTWDVAGNETNFFVRDVTNGSDLPFKIFPNAGSNALVIEGGTGDIGLGTTSPTEALHILNGDMRLQQQGSGVAAKILFDTAASSWELKQNGATGRLSFANTATPGAPLKLQPGAVDNLLRIGVAGTSTVDINGDLVITGQCTETDGPCADYVFEPDYALRTLRELETFISENGHLPNVPSADAMKRDGVNMTHLSGRLLEKIEELTLYTLQQQSTIDEFQKRLDAVEQASR